MYNASSASDGGGGGGGGGMREVGTVTAGMAVRNFDDRTRPYTRGDFLEFMQHYDTNLDATERRLIEKGLAITLVSLPLSFAAGYGIGRRLPWHKLVRRAAAAAAATTTTTASSAGGSAAASSGKWLRRVPLLGCVTCGMCAMSIPYALVQQWFVSRVLELDEHTSGLSFHVRRLMLTQRSSLMFTRTATREVTREEQQRLLYESEQHVNENRSGQRVRSGLGTGPVDVNLKLGQQMLTPVAQSGYKSMP